GGWGRQPRGDRPRHRHPVRPDRAHLRALRARGVRPPVRWSRARAVHRPRDHRGARRIDRGAQRRTPRGGDVHRQAAAQPRGGTDMNHGTILVVEDDLDIREVMRMVLEASGYQVLEAGDGAEALVVARAHRPDTILLDLMMPGMD